MHEANVVVAAHDVGHLVQQQTLQLFGLERGRQPDRQNNDRTNEPDG